MWDGHFLLPTSSSEDGRSQNMKQTKSNDERSKSGHSVRVHINNDDDRVTSCVKMRIANNKKKKVQKCAPRESGSCGTFVNGSLEGTRPCQGGSFLAMEYHLSGGTFRVPVSFRHPRKRGRHNTVRSGSAAHKALHINEAVTFLHISPRQLSSFRFRFRRRRPLERALRHTTHRDLLPSHTPAPPTLKVRHKERRTYCCVCPVLRACVRACVRE